MKDYRSQYFCASALVMSLFFTSQVFAEVYKTIDENGNVVYTDQPPGPDAIPMELPGLSIISAQKPLAPPVIASSVPASGGPEPEAQQEVTSIRELRRGYRDFAIVSPTQGQTIWSTGNETSIAWNTRYRLQRGMNVIIYVDGAALPPTTVTVTTVGPLYRGEHNVRAELIDARNRRIASTKPITFHIKQYSVNFPTQQSQGG